eukprot:gene12628-6532_t
MKKFVVLLLFISALSCFAKVGYFWQLSDPHLDREYKHGGDTKNCNFEIVCCRHTFPNTTSKAGKFGHAESLCNAPIVTIKSAYEFIKTYSQRLSPQPSFLLMTGDFVGHDNEFQSDERNLKRINEFTEFSESMNSGMKVYPSFGNHDGFPVDQLKLPPNKYLNELSRIWSKHKLSQKSLEEIKRGGYYSETIMSGLRIVNINTQWTNTNNFYLYVNETDDHANQMKWLDETFKEAEEKNEKIILLGHIKPGGSSRWPAYKLYHFEKLIQKYHHRVVGQFYGHNHADDFAFMMSQDNKIINSMFVGGVVVPHPKNPTVRLYKYDVDTYKLLDYEVFYIDLKEAERNDKITWKMLYKFTQEYGVPDLSNESMETVYQSFKTSDVHWNKHRLNFRSRYVNSPCSGGCKISKLCQMISPTPSRLEECRKKNKF